MSHSLFDGGTPVRARFLEDRSVTTRSQGRKSDGSGSRSSRPGPGSPGSLIISIITERERERGVAEGKRDRRMTEGEETGEGVLLGIS